MAKETLRKSKIHVYVTRMAGVIQMLDHHMLTFDDVLYVNWSIHKPTCEQILSKLENHFPVQICM